MVCSTQSFILYTHTLLWQYKNLAQIVCFQVEIRASWVLFYSYVLAGLLLLVCSTQSFILYTHTLSNYESVKVKWSKITSQFFLSSKSMLWQYKNLAQIICFHVEIRASWLLFYSYVLAGLLIMVCSTQSFILYTHTLSNYECVKVKWSKITSQFFLSSKSVLWQYKNLAQIICFNLEIRASWLLFYSYVLAGLLIMVCSTQSLACTLILCQTTSV